MITSVLDVKVLLLVSTFKEKRERVGVFSVIVKSSQTFVSSSKRVAVDTIAKYSFPLQASGGVRADPELLPHGQAALPHRRVRPAVRGGARVLGSRHKPSRAN